MQETGYFQTTVNVSGNADASYDISQQVVGVGSYKFDSGTSEQAFVTVNGVLGAQRRMSFYWQYDSVPDVTVTNSGFCEDNAVYSGGGFADLFGTTSDDGIYATATPARNAGQGSKMIVLGSLDIPAGVVILSVKISYERKYDVNTSIGISRVKWVLNGEEGPDHDNTDMPLIDTVVEVDVTGDRFWEWQDLQPGVFEVIAEARRGDTDTAHTQSWDYVKVEVVYHRPAQIIELMTSGNQPLVSLAVKPKGSVVQVLFIDGAGDTFTGITELPVNTFNRISFGYSLNGLNSLDIQIFVNGIPELLIEGAHTNSQSSVANLRYGWIATPGDDHLCWFDQIHVDNGDDLSDTRNVFSTAKLPAAVNEDNWGTTGTGAVNERPLSETNFRSQSAGTPTRQTYTLQTAATGDVDISGESLIGYMGWAWTKRISDLNQIALIVNNTSFARGSLSTTPVLIRNAVVSGSYPSHAAGIGMLSDDDSATVFLYECGVIVAYEGPLNPDILLERQLVNGETLDTIIDDLRADPPDSYEVCCTFDDFDGTVEIIIHSLDQDGGSLQQQGTLNARGRLRITPGVEVRLDVTVVGVTNLQIWRRLNVD